MGIRILRVPSYGIRGIRAYDPGYKGVIYGNIKNTRTLEACDIQGTRVLKRYPGYNSTRKILNYGVRGQDY